MDKGLVHSGLTPSIPTELVARLGLASEGSRELDCDIGIALGLWSPPKGSVRHPDRPDVWVRYGIRHYQQYTEVTTSLDAALALAERLFPGHAMNVCKDQGPPEKSFRWSSVIARHSLAGPVGRPDWWFGVSDTPALALCVAILRATTAASNKLGGDEPSSASEGVHP